MTKFSELYKKGLDRKVNPAVSASDLNDDTVLTEIVEYVFTPEIVANLYNILINVKVNQGSHIGIWVNGYYGSGKSHFLKYASYCLSSKGEYREMAFERLIEATNELLKQDNNMQLEQAGVSISELKALQNWYVNKANVEMVMFNIGDVHDANSKQATAFTSIFWNQFNAHRGYNSFNLALAQHLEKALDDDGKFTEFKAYVSQKGYDWKRNISRFAAGRLDIALQLAKEVDPELATDVIRERILQNDVNVSVEAFAAEMKEYLDKKNDRNYRILFFVDEVSQFIGEHRDLLLQLQSLVKRLDEVCESRVWIACTAQQTLEEVVSKVGGSTTNPEDEVGKILGHFEVRASLQGTSPEYITQRRILEKTDEAEQKLKEMYKADKAKLEAQFVLPGSYKTYSNAEDFAGYYPFVPYQFQLIMKVLDSFVNLNYVDKQVKGNERSLINITYSIAKETQNDEVEEFIPFDRFFGAMFQGSMQHLGQRAMENARQALEQLPADKDQTFYRRVVYVLFMIANMSDADKLTFSATTDNLATLLMTKVDASKADLKNKVSAVLDYLVDKSVISCEKTKENNEVYKFYSEEESRVAQLIKNQQVDSNTYSEELYKMVYNHFGFSSSSNKENYCTRSFSVGGNVDGRACLANNADVIVDFLTTAGTRQAEEYAFSNPGNHLVFFLYPLFDADKELRRKFLDYCRVQRFALEPAVSEERQRTKQAFMARAKEMYDKEIKPRFQHILDTCPVISGPNVLTASELGTKKKQERYKAALTCHLQHLYNCATLVYSAQTPKTQNDLSNAILRPIEPEMEETPLSTAVRKVKDYLERQPHDVTVAEVIRDFAKVPYGWSDIATIYTINELVRRHLYAFNYNNNPNVSREETARNIVREAGRFTITTAKAIPQEVLNGFIEAWKEIFNVVSVNGGNDATELFRHCKEKEDSALNRLLKNYRDLSRKIATYPFAAVIDEAIAKMEEWEKIRDAEGFFTAITQARESAKHLFDRCKSANSFVNEQFARYQEMWKFLNDNRDNFAFLPQDLQPMVEELELLQADKEPWLHFPPYLKKMRNLKGSLETCKAGLIATVKENYSKVFDELDEYAKLVGVTPDKYAKRDITLSLQTSTGNFFALKNNADTSRFYEEQMQRINQAIPDSGTRSSGKEHKNHKAAA